jgi:hypothetical protein
VVVALLGAARESLTNAARHAPGQVVQIGLEYSSTGVRLEVRNRLGLAMHRVAGEQFEDDGADTRDHGGVERPVHEEAGRPKDAAPLTPGGEDLATTSPFLPADARGAAADEPEFEPAGREHSEAGKRKQGETAWQAVGGAGTREHAAPLIPIGEASAHSPSPSPADARGAAAGEAGFGLAGMRERVALVGGRVAAGPVDGDWVVLAEVDDE